MSIIGGSLLTHYVVYDICFVAIRTALHVIVSYTYTVFQNSLLENSL